MPRTLLDFLSFSCDPANIDDHPSSTSTTTSDKFYEDDITEVSPWDDFSPEWVEIHFRDDLDRLYDLPSDPYASPQKGRPERRIAVERELEGYAQRTIFIQLNRALEKSSALIPSPCLYDAQHHPRGGTLLADHCGLLDDRIVLVGETKLSWRWHSSWHDSVRESNFKRPLAQLLFYMHEEGIQYGYLLTDREFMAVRRTRGDVYGAVDVATPVKWGERMVLAMWGLYILAANADSMPGLRRDEESSQGGTDDDDSTYMP